MLLPKEIINRIDEIVERSYLSFVHDILGDDFLSQSQKTMVESLGLLIGRKPLVELLYLMVRQRSSEQYLTDHTLNTLLEQISTSNILPNLPDHEQATVNNAKDAIGHAIDNTKSAVVSNIKKEIIKANDSFKKEQTINNIVAPIALKEKEKDHTALILLGVTAALASSHKSFVRDFTTQTTSYVNNTVVDTAVADTNLPQTQASSVNLEPLVYKKVISDGSLCPYCNSFYLNADGTPRVFTLSELQANGSNDGRPKAQWRPTISSSHPRCRCQLLHLPVGHLFEKGTDKITQVDIKTWEQRVKSNNYTT
jgi:hypothetical protein